MFKTINKNVPDYLSAKFVPVNTIHNCKRRRFKNLCRWPEIRDIEPTFRQRSTALNLKMAATKRLSTRVDYVQLDNFSSVVLYDNSVPRRKKGKIYEVERIISRKKEKHVSVIVIFDKFTWNIYLT